MEIKRLDLGVTVKVECKEEIYRKLIETALQKSVDRLIKENFYLLLRKGLKELGEEVYHDTDSIVFVLKEEE